MDGKQRFEALGYRDVSAHRDAASAVERIAALWEEGVSEVRGSLDDFAAARKRERPDAVYPFVGVAIEPGHLNLDARLAFGVLHEPGLYATTLSRPAVFRDYYLEQIGHLIANHSTPIHVGRSPIPIPVPFAVEEVTGKVPRERQHEVPYHLAMPDLSITDDAIANCAAPAGDPRPLALFTAPRVDYSLHRIAHYTATSPEHVQRYIVFTNYQRYVVSFREMARALIEDGQEGYDRFVEPGDVVTSKGADGALETIGQPPGSMPQMPAYHLTRPDGEGVTMVDIGVGPANARTITDHLAVLRPHCWIMLGHCAGLRRSQVLGDYVLAHGYLRDDHVLDRDLPAATPLPPIAEVQVALQEAVARVTGASGRDLKTRMRTGTVATTDNRNWELRYHEFFELLNRTRSIAVDMESATIAANGFRFRVPYGTLLCVSDKPLHGELKLRGMANQFYRERIGQHLEIGLTALRILREQGSNQLHSRKLRGFDEPAFR